MPGKALLNARKPRVVLEATEKWEAKAIDAFKREVKQPLEPVE